MAITLAQINSNMEGLGLKKKKGLEDDLLKGMSDKNLEGVQSALRGAEVKAKVNNEPPPGRIEDAKALDPEKPENETPKSNDKQQLLYQALIAAVPTLIGAAVGGNEGGAVGAKVGGDAIIKMENDKKEAGKLAFEQSLKRGELAEKTRQRNQEDKKIALEEQKIKNDKEMTIAKINSEQSLKQTEKQIAGAKDKRDAEFKLQSMWDSNPLTKNYGLSAEGLGKIRQAAQANINNQPGEKNQYDDVALIFNFMKVLDPTSVVREGEYKTAANNAGLLERLGINWQKVQNGEPLNDNLRQKIADAAERQHEANAQVYNQYATGIQEIALRNGLDARNVMVGYQPGGQKTAPAAPAKTASKGGVKEANAAAKPMAPKGMIHIRNEKTGEEYFIPEGELKNAEGDGFKKVK